MRAHRHPPASRPMVTGRYFLGGSDGTLAPPVYPGQVTPLINGLAYFARLAADIQRLGRGPRAAQNEFLYVAGFVINLVYPDAPLMVPGPAGPVRLIDLLVEKARAGVDVRVLSWIPWNLALAGKLDLRPESGDNMRTIAALREEPAMAGKACLNIIAHPAGSSHVKMLVMGGAGWSAGYSGGIDLSPDRLEPSWLDVQARVEGPAAQSMYDLYREMWNQNLAFSGANGKGQRSGLLRVPRPKEFAGRAGSMPGVMPGTPPVPARWVFAAQGPHRVQPLLTLPAFRFALSPLISFVRVAPLEFAPGGLFQVREAVRNAIHNARHYIYIEDQYFWSAELMGWINAAVRAHPGLRVLMVTGETDQLRGSLEAYRAAAVAGSLLPGLSEAQRRQVLFLQRSEMVHAKTILIDDAWALIGSANVSRRSHYMDIEHALAFGDEQAQLVRAYRAALWRDRLDLPEEALGLLQDPARALALWNPDWGPASLPEFAEGIYRPLFSPLAHKPSIDREWYEMVIDPDSRRPWYFPLRRSYRSYYEE